MLAAGLLVRGEALRLGQAADQVHDQGEEGEGRREQRVWVEELDGEVEPRVPSKRRILM